MKNNFKGGDRVRRRGSVEKGTVFASWNNFVTVNWDGGESGESLSIELIKRLKPKRKAREVWIKERDIPKPLHSGIATISSAELVGDVFIKFREILRPKPKDSRSTQERFNDIANGRD